MNKLDNKIEKCFYCKERFSEEDCIFHAKLYQIYKVTTFPIGYKYNEKVIRIPRCNVCKKKHEKFFGSSFIISWLIVSTISIWYFFHFGNIFVVILLSIFISGIIIGLIFNFLEFLFFKKLNKIPRESDFDDYPPAKQLLSLGWKKRKPDPASVDKYDVAKDSPYYKQ